MFKQSAGEFEMVPYSAVTLNGIYLTRLNTEESPDRIALIAPNGRAVDGEDSERPHMYMSVSEAAEDAEKLTEMGEYSTCGGSLPNPLQTLHYRSSRSVRVEVQERVAAERRAT